MDSANSSFIPPICASRDGFSLFLKVQGKWWVRGTLGPDIQSRGIAVVSAKNAVIGEPGAVRAFGETY